MPSFTFTDELQDDPPIIATWEVMYYVNHGELKIDDVYLDKIEVYLLPPMKPLPIQLQTASHTIEHTAERLRKRLDMELVRDAAVEDWLSKAHLYEERVA